MAIDVGRGDMFAIWVSVSFVDKRVGGWALLFNTIPHNGYNILAELHMYTITIVGY